MVDMVGEKGNAQLSNACACRYRVFVQGNDGSALFTFHLAVTSPQSSQHLTCGKVLTDERALDVV